MKKLLLVVAVSLASFSCDSYIIQAQALPYSLVVSWDASPDAQTYNCYLDGVLKISQIITLTCSFPVDTLGEHTVSVTAVNSSYIPSESVPASLVFTLKSPGQAKNIRVK